MSSDAAEVVRRYFAAWPARDRAGAEAVVAPDFHFTSPLDNRLDRETFFARCWPNSETMRSLDLKRVVSDGATVFVTYELTHKEGHRLRNSEVLTVRDNQVIEVEVYSAGRYLTGRRSEATWRGRRYERRSRNPIPPGARDYRAVPTLLQLHHGWDRPTVPRPRLGASPPAQPHPTTASADAVAWTG